MSGITTEVIHSAGELFAAASHAAKQFHNQAPWFRGQECADSRWTLLPKVLRGWSRRDEMNLMTLFQLRARTAYGECPQPHDHAGWLCLMQHYGIPTRLLDWSESILVAAYFAVVAKDVKDDAVIWALSPELLNASFGKGNGVHSAGTKDAEAYLASVLSLGRDLAPVPCPQGVLAILIPYMDLRMALQQAAFTIHGEAEALERLDGCHQFLMRFVIPKMCRATIASDLKAAGIGHSTIFPDLSGLAKDLEDRYPPTPTISIDTQPVQVPGLKD